MTDLKPNDAVEVTYQGIVRRITPSGIPEIEVPSGDLYYPQPQDCEIEIIGRIVI